MKITKRHVRKYERMAANIKLDPATRKTRDTSRKAKAAFDALMELAEQFEICINEDRRCKTPLRFGD